MHRVIVDFGRALTSVEWETVLQVLQALPVPPAAIQVNPMTSADPVVVPWRALFRQSHEIPRDSE